MKLAECRATAREFSGKASEITRTLCYSAIAVIWVFRTQSEAGVALPASLFAPGFFVVLALALDLFHYISGAFVWSGFARYRELHGQGEDVDTKVPRQLNWVPNFAFVGKIVSVSTAYVLLLRYLMARFA